jgi:hypothetical protein
VFSNNQNTCISKSDTVVVPSDSYHPALDLMYTFDYELPPIYLFIRSHFMTPYIFVS